MTGLKNLWKLRHSTLTNNIVVLLMVFGITPLAILFLVFQYVFISHEKEGIESLQRENAVRLAENISWYVNQSLTPIKVLGEMLDGDFSNQNHFRELDEFLVQHPEYDQLTILDLQGREVCKLSQNYTYLPSELEDRRVDSSIQGALSGRSLIPPLELLPGSRTLSLRLLSPITDAQAHVIGVLEARMNLIPLWAMIGKSNIAGNGSAYLISPDGLLPSRSGLFLAAAKSRHQHFAYRTSFCRRQYGGLGLPRSPWPACYWRQCCSSRYRLGCYSGKGPESGLQPGI